MNNYNIKICVFGLGYVGLPLAISFGKKYSVVGFDKNIKRIHQLKNKIDKNNEIKKNQFNYAKKLSFTSNIIDLKTCNIFIVTVPTPIKKNKTPDLSFLIEACKNIAKFLKEKDIVIFESTVYPGTTQEVCVPILKRISKLKYNVDFFCGYSPERINPNDKKHTLSNIIKITSGSNKKTTDFVDKLYKSIVTAGTYKASSIEIAEAAKVIENTQRDLNIAFMNELALIFNKLNINTHEVLKAASTKWNFLNFKPGLVGGHCIGVDPYYLTYKSIKSGYTPKIITAGSNINDKFVNYVLWKAIHNTKKIFYNVNLRFLVLGVTFKENCVDYRNSKSIELIMKLKSKFNLVHCYDPLLKENDFNENNQIKLSNKLRKNYYHCIILSVPHNIFKKIGEKKLKTYLIKGGLFFDVKNFFPKNKQNLYL
jgi:UDP-N-acetyl-D-galactosamine dehydrogenase